MMLNVIAVFVGGGTGAVLRYLINTLFKTMNISNIHYATFIANILGCFLIGLLGAYLFSKVNVPLHIKLFATTGFCGGLSTFAALSVECLAFVNQGKYIELLIYTSISVIVCILAAGLGVWIAGKI